MTMIDFNAKFVKHLYKLMKVSIKMKYDIKVGYTKRVKSTRILVICWKRSDSQVKWGLFIFLKQDRETSLLIIKNGIQTESIILSNK
jgi:hypothetical protein